ncbi:hypothetical protein MIMGU_mgv1a025616mg [Erythranthe guttata]|uniref:F-box domain-containing protein n=1 Tax=Erythranthe guttata TaxID=4155 RepID=A0A022QZP9_ERYGU|nr:PREDICTED: F-box/kelch-repeat protein At3g06240-like [Erythranthe guttata]EYU33144.1 hypothetical protein MIMGU_mgv1a025616mg [Erythranthe guttata]|eukprot:XP_012842443.1 PREDICTED: F-box/kelch-repeat protein At3g06240-like [Erythranthe guttata]
MAIPELPHDIWIDIFSRLPLKSVGKCRCLSKPWRTFLSSREFIKSHLTIKTLNQQNLLLVTLSNSIQTIANVKNDTVSRKLGRIHGYTLKVVGSCDGLVLLVNEKNDKFLVNPTTLHVAKLPNSPLALKSKHSSTMHGFGYDSYIDDYKVVALSYYDSDTEYEPDCVDTFVDVYCVRRGVWKRVESSPYDHSAPVTPSGAYLNGAVHWLAGSRESGHASVIAAFDLVNEVFTKIPAPNKSFEYSTLEIFGGCLCMIVDRMDMRTDIWVMKEYGLADSWIKYTIGCGYDYDILNPLCYIWDEGVVWMTYDGRLAICNPKDETFKDMIVDGVPAKFTDGCVFVESLVSPCL